MNDKFVFFLNDTIKELIVRATEAKNKPDFDYGILIGHYNSISLILNQAEAFEILKHLDKEIQDFVPETLLNL